MVLSDHGERGREPDDPPRAEYDVTSCDVRVFLDQAAEPVPP
jgi:hypothetical protein